MKNAQIKSIRFRVVTASSLATILEWYDFSLFAYMTPMLAKLFFPKDNMMTSIMLTYSIFAIGFFVRPLGAILFGHLGDRIGRKKTLTLSILLMSLSTLFMGILPTYQNIGIAAPILLIVLRVCQGLSAGGESTGATIFVLESMDTHKRGFLGAFLWSMVGIGMLLGSFAGSLVAQYSHIYWSWRIPFLFGLVTGGIAYFLRTRTLETPVFERISKLGRLSSFPLLEGMTQYKKEIFIIIGLYTLSAMITYLIFIFMPTYAANVIGMSLSKTTMISSFTFLLSTLLVPMGGYLSDKVGRNICLRGAALGFVLLSYPLFYLISQGSLIHLVFAQGIFLILAACFQGPLTATVIDMLPTEVRYSVIAVGYNVSYALFGGTAPLIAMSIVNVSGNKASPGLYLMIGALFAWLAANKLNNRRLVSPYLSRADANLL